MTDAILIMRGLEEMYPEIRYIERLRQTMEMYPTLNWGDAMSRGQISSKLWLVRELQSYTSDIGNVAVCGGWVGILSRMLLDTYVLIGSEHIHTMDTDSMATLAAKELNDEYLRMNRFSATTTDCYSAKYDRYDTVINTSCEHFADFHSWFANIEYGTMVVLQSNDFTSVEDHVDCVFHEDELEQKANLEHVHFKGSLPCYGYTRFMLIGVK